MTTPAYTLAGPVVRPVPANPGAEILRGLTFGEYREIDACNGSTLKAFAESPADALWRKHHPIDLPQFRFGNASHTRTLEPHKFDLQYACRPAGLDLRTKQGKAWKDSVGDRHILSAEDTVAIERMTDAVNSNNAAAGLLADTDREITILWTEPSTGVRCKARLDIALLEPTGHIADYKTCADHRPDAIRKTLINFDYALSAAFYVDAAYVATGLELPFYIIACRKTPPHPVEVYRLTNEVLEYGRRRYRQLLEVYADCLESGDWPSSSNEINELDLPAWAKTR